MRTVLRTAVILAGALAFNGALAQATPPAQPAPGTGMTGCPGHGYGMGMGGGMMGPGMMGQGMGPGMMGPGTGPGMMGPGMGYHYGYGMLGGLNLSEQQRKDVSKLMDQQQKRQYELLGKRMDLQSKLRDLYAQENWDANAIGAVYDQMAKLNGQMIRNRIELRNRIYALLTPEQRKTYRQWGDPVPDGA